MSLYNQKFIQKSLAKWPQEKIDNLSIVVFKDDKKLFSATPRVKKGIVKQIVKLKGDKDGKGSSKHQRIAKRNQNSNKEMLKTR